MSSLGDENEFCEPMVVISLISKDGSTGPNGGCCLHNLVTRGCVLQPVNLEFTNTSRNVP